MYGVLFDGGGLPLKINAGLTRSKILPGVGRGWSLLFLLMLPNSSPLTLWGGCLRLGPAAEYMQMASNCALAMAPLW